MTFQSLLGRNYVTICCLQGRYLPAFAAAVYDQNAYLVETGMPPINVSSVMIGILSFKPHWLFYLRAERRKWDDGYANHDARLVCVQS